MSSGNDSKREHGDAFHRSIMRQLDRCVERGEIEDYAYYGKRGSYGYAGYKPTQFFVPFEIFSDGSIWGIYTTTSYRDRFKSVLWDAYHVKQINHDVEACFLIFPTSIS